MRKAQAGFTLIELMAAVAIITILTAIGAPNLGRMVKTHRATATLNALTTDLALARMAAISRGKTVTACPSRDATTCLGDNDWTEGWLVFVDNDRDRRLGAGEQVLSTHQAERTPELQLHSSIGRDILRYLPSGFSYGSNATITACLDGKVHATLVINNAGRVRVERATRSARPCGATQG